MKKTLLLLLLTGCCSLAAAQERSPLRRTEVITADSLDNDAELLERLRNMPNLEVGKGITFRPKSNWFSLTMRFRKIPIGHNPHCAICGDDPAIHELIDYEQPVCESKVGKGSL